MELEGDAGISSLPAAESWCYSRQIAGVNQDKFSSTCSRTGSMWSECREVALEPGTFPWAVALWRWVFLKQCWEAAVLQGTALIAGKPGQHGKAESPWKRKTRGGADELFYNCWRGGVALELVCSAHIHLCWPAQPELACFCRVKISVGLGVRGKWEVSALSWPSQTGRVICAFNGVYIYGALCA